MYGRKSSTELTDDPPTDFLAEFLEVQRVDDTVDRHQRFSLLVRAVNLL